MRTTLELDDDLIAEAKALAAAEKKTLTRLIEEALAARVRPRHDGSEPPPKPLRIYHGKGGLRDTVADSLTNRALFDALDEEQDS